MADRPYSASLRHAVRSTVVTVNGQATHYLEAGPANERSPETVLLVHDGAYGGDATSMVPLMDLLADRYRVVAPDLLGYGRTAKVVSFGANGYDFRIDHLAQFCRVVGIQRAHGVGVSYGGSMLLRSCAYGTLRLPLASVTSVTGTGGPWRRPSALADYDGSLESMRALMELFIDPAGPAFGDLVSRRHAASLAPGHVEALRAARVPGVVPRTSHDDDWPQALAGCEVPVLLVEAADDLLLEPGWPAHFEDVVPRLRTLVVEGRHLPTLDNPEPVAAAVAEVVQACREHEAEVI